MKKPVRRRGYDAGGAVDPNSMSRQIQSGMGMALKLMGTADALSGGKSAVDSGSWDLSGSKGAARGGRIKHTAGPRIGKDDGLIPAQRGEYVVRRSAVKKLGTKALDMINKGKLPKAGRRAR